MKTHRASTPQLLQRLKKLKVSVSLEELSRLRTAHHDPASLCASLPAWSRVRGRHRAEALELIEAILDRLETPEQTLARHLWHARDAMRVKGDDVTGLISWAMALQLIPDDNEPLPASWLAVLDEVFEEEQISDNPVDAWAHQLCIHVILQVIPKTEKLPEAVEIRTEVLSRLGPSLSPLGRWLVEVDEIPLLAMHGNLDSAEAVFRRCRAARPEHPYAYVRWAEALGEWGDDLEGAAAVIAEGQRLLVDPSDDWGLEDLRSDLNLDAPAEA